MQDIIVFMQNHWALSLGLVVILIILIFLEFMKQKQNTMGLSPARVTHLINHDNAAVIDVRAFEAYASGHIVGAVSIPTAEIEGQGNKIGKYKSQPVVLVCAAGLDSTRIAPSLQKQGYNVYILSGGVRAWKDAGLPLVKN